MEAEQILADLRQLENEHNLAGMARFGINPNQVLGISIPTLRKMARAIGRDHALATSLWASSIHEARILASMIDDPRLIPLSLDICFIPL